MTNYNHMLTEQKWQEYWQENKAHTINTKLVKTKKFYNLVMFPYPSGDKLHIGHWYNYSGTDIYGRLKKLQGYEVLQPMGFDSFGLPAENYAIKTGVAPKDSTEKNVAKMREQLGKIGAMWNWDHEVVTSEQSYYRWTQWIFSELYKNNLAYQKEAYVNWDPIDQTVLANEQVLADGTAERSGAVVEKKLLKQWFFKITEFAEDLLDHTNLDWPEKTVAMQKNWIGKSQGAIIDFEILNSPTEKLSVFTTRPDTLCGVTYMVISPEHPLVAKLISSECQDAVAKYLQTSKNKLDSEKLSVEYQKTGVFTGSYAVNPINSMKVPIWIGDYVLSGYGTGAIMAVPAHDERDMEFATKYKLPIIQVIDEDGLLINSGEFNGLSINEAKTKFTNKVGVAQTNYRLHDWLISRQRYWGVPIPIVYDPEGKPHLIPEEHLPWKLPTDVEFKPQGVSPLATSKEFISRTEKIFGKGWKPEFDTMDTFVCSSWYYLRYISSEENFPFCISTVNKWLPVDMYIGGPEHACMHLLYARFINIALHKLGYIKHKEPFKKLVHQGLITKDGAKMSKSKGNVVSPDELVLKYGSDVFRMYLMFTGPFTDGGDWNDKGINGIVRFRDKLLKLMQQPNKSLKCSLNEFETKMHQTIKKVSLDLDSFNFNTAISCLMEFVNFTLKNGITEEGLKTLTVLIAPLAPHLAEECWHIILQQSGSVFSNSWPTFDESKIIIQTLEIVVQVNGKIRANITVDNGSSEEFIITLAKQNLNIIKYLDAGNLLKTVYVPNKLVNFVVK